MIKLPKSVLQDLQKALENEKTKVLAQITDLKAQDPFNDTDRLADNAAVDTEAKEEIDHERYQALLKEVNGRLLAIEETLKKINLGTYGMCIKCHELIDTDRLAAIPTASLCVICETNK